jgi:polygalacturonase
LNTRSSARSVWLAALLLFIPAGCVHGFGAKADLDPFQAVRDGLPPPLPPEPIIPPACITLEAEKTVVNFTLADADEKEPDTKRVQAAIDACDQGKSVRLVDKEAKNAFLVGPIVTRSGVTLWIDKGVTLFASRNPRDYDLEQGKPTCGTDEYDNSGGCQPIISVINVHDVGIMGEGIIDGRGGEPVIGSDQTWWDIAQRAKKNKNSHSNPRMIEVKFASNFVLYKVSLFNSPKFHAMINAQGFIVWGIKLLTPSHAFNSKGRPLDQHYARNTDGIDPSGASDGFIVHNLISTGDDHIAIKAGNAPTKNLIIAHNHFGSGHGMSIGSETNEDVSRIAVYDLSIDAVVQGPPTSDHSGLRIKSDPSRGGTISDIVYSNVCLRGLPNPILLSPHYDKDVEGSAIPEYKDIYFHNIWSEPMPGMKRPPRLTFVGYGEEYLTGVHLDNVYIAGVAATDVKTAFANINLGPGPVNIDFSKPGEQVTFQNQATGQAQPNPKCADKFIRFPYQTDFGDIKMKEDHVHD